MQTESTEPIPKPLPIWLSIPIILICLTGGGWIIHWYVMTDPISHESKILGDAPVQVQLSRPNNRNRPNIVRRGVADQGNGKWEIRTEKARGNLSETSGKTTIHNLFYFDYSFVPEADRKVIQLTNAMLRDQTRTAALKLTTAQVNKLRGLSFSMPMATSQADRNLLAAAMSIYVVDVKNRPANEQKVLQRLDEISDRSKDATAKQVKDCASQIDQIITPDMWKQNATMGGGAK